MANNPRPGAQALVFFATGPAWLRTWAIRTVTRSPIAHVAIGYDGVALNPTLDGDRAYPLIHFAHHHPRLIWCFDVPLSRPIRLWLDPWPRSIWPTVLRWLTRGLWPTRDCVQEVCRYLREGGLDVPRRLTTPAALFDWLRSEGFHCEDFGRFPGGCADGPAGDAGPQGAGTGCDAGEAGDGGGPPGAGLRPGPAVAR